jgi:protein subunit release factor A
MTKKLLFTLSREKGDFLVDFYSGTGPGGQNRNHNKMCCRIKHPQSGVMAACAEERSQEANKKKAFTRLVSNPQFQSWLRSESARRSGEMARIEAEVDRSMKKVKVEIKDEKGRWIEAEGL